MNQIVHKDSYKLHKKKSSTDVDILPPAGNVSEYKAAYTPYAWFTYEILK